MPHVLLLTIPMQHKDYASCVRLSTFPALIVRRQRPVTTAILARVWSFTTINVCLTFRLASTMTVELRGLVIPTVQVAAVPQTVLPALS